MQINDLIFKEFLKRGYTTEGKTRVWNIADSKLWYLTPKQAQGYLDLSKTTNYKQSIIEKEVGLIKQHLPRIMSMLPQTTCNIMDLGCGDGKKASLFIKEFTKHKSIRYYPIDISAYMVEKAAEAIRAMHIGEVLEFRWNISDFENLNNITALSRDKMYKTHFMMLLGNTLGNFDRDDMLHGIKNSMEKDDLLIIGNGITREKHSTWISAYKDDVINNWLIKVPLQLGLSKNDLTYDVRFVSSRIEELYTIKRDKSITHLNKTILFRAGDIIITAISYKYTKSELRKNLTKFFSRVNILTDKEQTYSLALCKK